MSCNKDIDEQYKIEYDVLFSIYLLSLIFVAWFQQNCLWYREIVPFLLVYSIRILALLNGTLPLQVQTGQLIKWICEVRNKCCIYYLHVTALCATLSCPDDGTFLQTVYITIFCVELKTWSDLYVWCHFRIR